MILQEVLDKTDLTEQVKNNIISKTIVVNSHWLYQSNEDYARVYYLNRLESLARIILNIANKSDELLACHKLECSIKSCWNPEHLYIGDRSSNTSDSVQMGTHNSNISRTKTHCKNGHEYTPENTKFQKSNGKRQCRECKRLARNPYPRTRTQYKSSN